MKKIIILPVLLFVSAISFSQKTIFSIGPELALPQSFGLKMNAGTGLGGSLRAEFTGRKSISAIITVGYLAFAQQELAYSGTPPTTTSVKAIQAQAGIKYYLRKIKEMPQGFFISAELGIMPTSTHFDYANNPDRNFKETGLSCAPGLGYQAGNIEAGFRLQYNLTASGFNVYYYNFRLAYNFLKIKKNNSH